MNVYTVTIVPKGTQGAGLGYLGNERQLTIVTGTLQEAMGIARSKCTDKEEIQGIYCNSNDVIVDYSHVIGNN